MLLCFGDLCVDLIARTAHAPGTGEDATVDHMAITMAGAAVNCAIAAAKEDVPVELMGIAGEDALGDSMLAHLANNGVGVQHVRRVAEPTGMVMSIVHPGGERTLYSFRGANAAAYGVVPNIKCDYVYLSGYSFQTELSRNMALELKAQATLCALDPSFQFARDFRTHYRETLSGLRFLLPNYQEAQLMTGETSVENCAAALRRFHVATVVIKLGGQGCYVDTGTVQQYVGAELLESAKDTTGAGDTFCGVFLASVLQGLDELAAAKRANSAARKHVAG